MHKYERGQELIRLDRAVSPATAVLHPRRRADVKTRVVDGEIVVLDRHEELIHQLNRTASYIWERCDGQRTPKEIAGQVCEVFEVDHSTALRDVLEIIQKLRKLKLIERA